MNFIDIFPMGPIENKAALVEIMAKHRTGDKPLSEPLMVLFTMRQSTSII